MLRQLGRLGDLVLSGQGRAGVLGCWAVGAAGELGELVCLEQPGQLGARVTAWELLWPVLLTTLAML